MVAFTLIISEIMALASSQFEGWRIGIAQDVLDWSAYQEGARLFRSWETDGLANAVTIKHFFMKLGMTDCTASDPLPRRPTYVYIIKN